MPGVLLARRGACSGQNCLHTLLLCLLAQSFLRGDACCSVRPWPGACQAVCTECSVFLCAPRQLLAAPLPHTRSHAWRCTWAPFPAPAMCTAHQLSSCHSLLVQALDVRIATARCSSFSGSSCVAAGAAGFVGSRCSSTAGCWGHIVLTATRACWRPAAGALHAQIGHGSAYALVAALAALDCVRVSCWRAKRRSSKLISVALPRAGRHASLCRAVGACFGLNLCSDVLGERAPCACVGDLTACCGCPPSCRVTLLLAGCALACLAQLWHEC